MIDYEDEEEKMEDEMKNEVIDHEEEDLLESVGERDDELMKTLKKKKMRMKKEKDGEERAENGKEGLKKEKREDDSIGTIEKGRTE